MKTLKILTSVSIATTLLLFSGCSCQPQIKYIKTKCPKLQVIDKEIKEPAPVKLEVLP